MKNPIRTTPKPIRFINKQAKKSFAEDLSRNAFEIFSGELEDVIAYGKQPTISCEPLILDTLELRKNGSPAFRCVYKIFPDCILVVHAFKKTAQGRDKKNLTTIEQRMSSLDPTQFVD